MRIFFTLLICAGAISGCQHASQSASVARMSLAEAELACIAPANQYARRPLPIPGENGAYVGLLAEYPDDYHVQWYYKRCVRAQSGESTKKRVDWRL